MAGILNIQPEPQLEGSRFCPVWWAKRYRTANFRLGSRVVSSYRESRGTTAPRFSTVNHSEEEGIPPFLMRCGPFRCDSAARTSLQGLTHAQGRRGMVADERRMAGPRGPVREALCKRDHQRASASRRGDGGHRQPVLCANLRFGGISRAKLGQLCTRDVDIASSTQYRRHNFRTGSPVLAPAIREHDELRIDCADNSLGKGLRVRATRQTSVMREDEHIRVQFWTVSDQVVESDPIDVAGEQKAR